MTDNRIGDLVSTICDVFNEVLEQDSGVGPETTFRDAGAASMELAIAVGELNERLNVALRIRDVFEHDSALALATYLVHGSEQT